MNKRTLLKNCRIIGKEKILENTDILIEDGEIAALGKLDTAENAEIYDINGNYISSGFVDIHTHGGAGADFMDATDEAFDKILRYQLENGVTDVVATSLTAAKSDIERFLECARAYMSKPQKYARSVGVHLEGPFLSLKGCGAQNPEYLMLPGRDDYGFIIKNRDIIKTVTIAPELDTDGKMTRELTENGILVSGGHDDGVYPEFMPAVKSGLRHLTHIYCAMSGIGTRPDVRDVGLREYGLTDDLLTCEMIADNVHVTPQMARFILKCKGAERTAVVSDSLRCAGMPADGRLYKMGPENDESSLTVRVADGIAVLADGSKFAGSITSVHKMVKNLIAAGISVTDAFKTGTSTPARIIGESKTGSVEKGFRANLCELDRNFDIVSVFMKGERVIHNEK